MPVYTHLAGLEEERSSDYLCYEDNFCLFLYRIVQNLEQSDVPRHVMAEKRLQQVVHQPAPQTNFLLPRLQLHRLHQSQMTLTLMTREFLPLCQVCLSSLIKIKRFSLGTFGRPYDSRFDPKL